MSRFEQQSTEEVLNMQRELAHIALGEWLPGEEGWLPPDNLGGDHAELIDPKLPPHIGQVALKPEVALAA